MPETRKLYNAAYRSTLDDDDQSKEPTNLDGDNSNTSDDNLSTDDRSWKKRYGDLRSYQNQLTERVKQLEHQLVSANKREIKFPSTKDELVNFANQYPDVYRHIRTIAMGELLQERENITQETTVVKEDLEKVKRELGEKKILLAHPDFHELNMSQDFHDWADLQPTQIKNWLFHDDDPLLCIKAIDLYKAEKSFKEKSTARRQSGADVQIRARSQVETPDYGDKHIWKASDIQRMNRKEYEKYEAELDKANREGRIDLNA